MIYEKFLSQKVGRIDSWNFSLKTFNVQYHNVELCNTIYTTSVIDLLRVLAHWLLQYGKIIDAFGHISNRVCCIGSPLVYITIC